MGQVLELFKEHGSTHHEQKSAAEMTDVLAYSVSYYINN